MSVFRGRELCQKSKPTANNDKDHYENDELNTYGVARDVIGWKSLEPSTEDHTP